jgi:hypothetical protein
LSILSFHSKNESTIQETSKSSAKLTLQRLTLHNHIADKIHETFGSKVNLPNKSAAEIINLFIPNSTSSIIVFMANSATALRPIQNALPISSHNVLKTLTVQERNLERELRPS